MQSAYTATVMAGDQPEKATSTYKDSPMIAAPAQMDAYKERQEKTTPSGVNFDEKPSVILGSSGDGCLCMPDRV